MQIIWLRAFVALSEQMSFSDAANEIFVSQSSFSKYIQSIEKTANVILFERSTRKIRLTEAGKLFYTYAIEIVRKYDEMMAAMQEFTSRLQHKIRVASVPATHIYGYSSLFFQFYKNNPDLDFDIEEIEMSQAMKKFKNAEVDFAVVRTNLVEECGYKELRFNDEELFFICGRQHPYAAKTAVSLDAIVKQQLVLQKFAFDEMKLLFLKYGIGKTDINILAVSTDNTVIAQYVRDGMGVSIMTRSYVNSFDPKGELLRIEIVERPRLTLGMLIRKGALSQPCYKLINFINDAVLINE